MATLHSPCCRRMNVATRPRMPLSGPRPVLPCAPLPARRWHATVTHFVASNTQGQPLTVDEERSLNALLALRDGADDLSAPGPEDEAQLLPRAVAQSIIDIVDDGMRRRSDTDLSRLEVQRARPTPFPCRQYSACGPAACRAAAGTRPPAPRQCHGSANAPPPPLLPPPSDKPLTTVRPPPPAPDARTGRHTCAGAGSRGRPGC